jgi:hypothetical protein
MRKLVFVLIAFIAAATLIKALDSESSPADIAVEIPDINLNQGR